MKKAESDILRRTCRLIPVLLVLTIAAGCGKSETKLAATQAAARVDSDEITIHQINAILANAPSVSPETAEQAKREILNRLIDQQLSAQQAIRRKLDRSPTVVQAIEAARLEILSRAYAEDIARTLPKPSSDEVKKYYSEHPELFAKRRIYNLEDIAVVTQEGLAGALRDQVAKARSTEEITAWLQARGAEFGESRSVRPAEQLPLDALKRLLTMKDGEIGLFESATSLNVIRVLASKTVPVDETTAAPRIQQFLFNRRLHEAVQKEMKQVRSAAKIQYLGEFADVAADQKKEGGTAEPAKAAPDLSRKAGG